MSTPASSAGPGAASQVPVEQLASWLQNDLLFRGDLPSKQALLRMQRGRLAGVWRWLIQHVVPEDTAEEVRRNVRLADDRASDEADAREAALLRRRRARDAATQLREQVQRASVEQDQLMSALAGSSISEEAASNVQEASHRTACLLQSVETQADGDVSDLATFLSRVLEQVEMVQSRRTSLGTSRSASEAELDTPCRSSVRDVCAAIEQALVAHHRYQAADVQDRIQPTLKRSNPRQIVDSVAALSRTAARSVVRTARSVDRKADAKRLMLQLSDPDGDGAGVGSPLKAQDHSVGDSVLDHLHRLRAQHVQDHVDTLRWRAEAAGLDTAVENAVEAARVTLSSKEVTELCEILQRAERDLAATQCVIAMVEQRCKTMRSAIAAASTTMECVQQAFEQVNQYDQDRVQRQATIQRLIHSNMLARRHLETERRQARTMLQTQLLPVASQVDVQLHQLRHCVQRDVAAFSAIDARQHHCDGAGRAVRDMSIYAPRAGDAGILRDLAAALDVPEHATMHQSALAIMAGSARAHELQERIQQLSRSSQALHQHEDAPLLASQSDMRADLQRRVHELRQAMQEKWTPRLAVALDEASAAIHLCADAEDAVDIWWRQPAQFAAPWVRVADHPLEHYVTAWRRSKAAGRSTAP